MSDPRPEYRIALVRWEDILEGDVVRELLDNGARGQWHRALGGPREYERDLGLNLMERQVRVEP